MTCTGPYSTMRQGVEITMLDATSIFGQARVPKSLATNSSILKPYVRPELPSGISR